MGLDDSLVQRVLAAVELIPPGQVVSYGDLAELFEIGPRQVGMIMSRHGHQVCWWRVTNSYGDLPPHLHASAREHWAAERIDWKPNQLGCRIHHYRADLPSLGDALRHLLETVDGGGEGRTPIGGD